MIEAILSQGQGSARAQVTTVNKWETLRYEVSSVMWSFYQGCTIHLTLKKKKEKKDIKTWGQIKN